MLQACTLLFHRVVHVLNHNLETLNHVLNPLLLQILQKGLSAYLKQRHITEHVLPRILVDCPLGRNWRTIDPAYRNRRVLATHWLLCPWIHGFDGQRIEGSPLFSLSVWRRALLRSCLSAFETHLILSFYLHNPQLLDFFHCCSMFVQCQSPAALFAFYGNVWIEYQAKYVYIFNHITPQNFYEGRHTTAGRSCRWVSLRFCGHFFEFLVECNSIQVYFFLVFFLLWCPCVNVKVKTQQRSNLPARQLVSMVMWWAPLIQMLLSYLRHLSEGNAFHFLKTFSHHRDLLCTEV